MDNNGILLCKIQADLFSHCDDFCSYSSYVFIRRFMNSDLANRFDDMTVLLEISSNETFIDEINSQYGASTFGKKKKTDKEMMYWLGYVYRYWSYVYEIPSYLLFKHVQPHLILDRYALYHSMGIDYFINRLIEEEEIYLPPHKTVDQILDEYIRFMEEKDK